MKGHFMQSNIQIIFNLSEIGAGTRGASLGPQAIAAAARKKESTFFGEHRISVLPIISQTLDRPTPYPFAKRIDGMLEVYQAVVEEVGSVLKSGKFPFIVAGDHCSAGGSIAGIKKAFPGKRLGVLWVDAHADLHTPYTTPSGNMHGMPLATALGVDNEECQRNNVDEETANMWNQLKSNAIQAEDLVFVAVRDTEEEEDALMNRFNIRNYKVDEVRELGVAGLVDKLRNHFANCDMLYISFDVDSMDPELTSHGTGTPVPHGLTPEEAKELLKACVQFPNTIAFELVEVNPCLDEKQNKMAEVAFEIIEELVATIENK